MGVEKAMVCAEAWSEAGHEGRGEAAHGQPGAGAGPCGGDPGGPGCCRWRLGLSAELPPRQVLDVKVTGLLPLSTSPCIGCNGACV